MHRKVYQFSHQQSPLIPTNSKYSEVLWSFFLLWMGQRILHQLMVYSVYSMIGFQLFQPSMVQDFAGPTVGVPSFARPSFAWRSLPAWEKLVLFITATWSGNSWDGQRTGEVMKGTPFMFHKDSSFLPFIIFILIMNMIYDILIMNMIYYI